MSSSGTRIGDVKDDNLWASLLRESSKRSNYFPDSKIFVFGDTNSGKSSLIKKLSSLSSLSQFNNSTQLIRDRSKVSSNFSSALSNQAATVTVDKQGREVLGKSFVEYSYLDVDESMLLEGNDSAAIPPIHIWSFDSYAFGNQFDFFQGIAKQDRVLFAILVDVTKPATECLRQLRKTLRIINEKLSILQKRLGSDSDFFDQKKCQHMHYLSNAKCFQPGSKSPHLPASTMNMDSLKDVASLFGFPIVVIAHKADELSLPANSDDYQALQRSKLLQGQLRSVCLSVGAAFLCSSVYKDANIVRLRKYLQHRLYPEVMGMELDIDDSSNNIDSSFVPSGFDSHALISISTGFPSDEGFADLQLNVALVEEEDVFQISPLPAIQVEVESEKDWLSSLQLFVNQVTAGSGPGANVGIMRTISENNINVPESASSSSSNSNSTNGSLLSTGAGVGTVGGGSITSGIMRRSSLAGVPAISTNDATSTISSTNAVSSSGDASTVGGDASAAETNSSATEAKAVLRSTTRRTISTRTQAAGAGQEQQDVGDFFKNLLATNSKQKK